MNFSHTISWNRVLADGILAPIGNYRVTLRAIDEAGNTSQKTAEIIIPAPNAAPLPTFPPTPTATIAPNLPSPTPTTFVAQPTATATKESSGLFTFGSKDNTSPEAPMPDFPSTNPNNILWGTAAAAALGLFNAKIAEKKRREAEARHKAKARRKAKEARKHQKVLTGYAAQVRARILGRLARQEAFARQRRAKRDAEEDAPFLRRSFHRKKLHQARAAEKKSWVQRVRKKERMAKRERFLAKKLQITKKSTYVLPDMSWKRADMAETARAVEAESKHNPYKIASPVPTDPPPEKNFLQRAWAWILNLFGGEKQYAPTTTPTPDVDAIYTQVAGTIIAELTQTAQPTKTPTFTPTATPAVTPSPTSTSTAAPVYTPVPGGTGDRSFYWYGKEFYDILNPLSPRNSDRSPQWWDNYQGEPFGEKTFLAVTYNYEMSSLGNDPIAKELVTEAFARRYWQSQLDYGPDGKYWYLGGRDSVWVRANNGVPGINESDHNMSSAMTEADRILNTAEWQNGVAWDSPYDWGNPYSDLNPETTKRIKHFLPEFWKALQSRNVGPADDQILHISNDGNFFVVTQGQTTVLCKNQSCVNPFPNEPVP